MLASESETGPLTEAQVQALTAKLHAFAAGLTPAEQAALAFVLWRAALDGGAPDVEGYSTYYYSYATYYAWLSSGLAGLGVAGPIGPGPGPAGTGS